MNKFTNQQKKWLKENSFEIFTLTGKSMKDLRADGFRFWSSWHEGGAFEDDKSRIGEMAIKVDEDIVEESDGKTYAQTLDFIKNYNKGLPAGTEGVMASHADYLEVWHQYQKKTGKSLFTEAKWIYTWTNTEHRDSGDSDRLIAGRSDGGGAAVVGWDDPASENPDIGWRAAVVLGASGPLALSDSPPLALDLDLLAEKVAERVLSKLGERL